MKTLKGGLPLGRPHGDINQYRPIHHQEDPCGPREFSRIGPTTRAMTKKLQEDWNTATGGRETFLYMFKTP